jgi:hypothetical protein
VNGFKGDLNERLDAAAKAKQVMLEKFRASRPRQLPRAAAEAAAPQPAADGG